MRGVVPQKGFQMDLSINPSSPAGDKNWKIKISLDHCKKLSNILWDWLGSLPQGYGECIEVITVNTKEVEEALPPQISIKVILSGVYTHYKVNGSEEESWKNQFEVDIVASQLNKMLDDTAEIKLELTRKLRLALQEEIKTLQLRLSKLNSLFELTSVRY